jgi:hypothetical protein
MLQYLSLATETLVTLVFQHLRLENHLQLVIRLVALHQTRERGCWPLEVALLTSITKLIQRLRLLQVAQLK